jgi:hypothetical protein
LTGAAAALAERCGLAVAPGGARHDALTAAPARTLLLPTLLTRDRAAALRDARPLPRSGTGLVIGWRPAADVPYAGAVADGIASILAKRPDLVEVVGDPERVPSALRGHKRVTVLPEQSFKPEVLAGWAAHVWTPRLLGDALLDDARLLEEAGVAGVATLLPSAATTGIDGFVSPFVQVESPGRAEDWTNALHHVLDDPGVRAQRAGEARRRADTVDGLAAARATVSRLVGWAAYRAGDAGRVAVS